MLVLLVVYGALFLTLAALAEQIYFYVIRKPRLKKLMKRPVTGTTRLLHGKISSPIHRYRHNDAPQLLFSVNGLRCRMREQWITAFAPELYEGASVIVQGTENAGIIDVTDLKSGPSKPFFAFR